MARCCGGPLDTVDAMSATPSSAVSSSCGECASKGRGRYRTVTTASGNCTGEVTTTGVNAEPPSLDCADASLSVLTIDARLNVEIPKNEDAD